MKHALPSLLIAIVVALSWLWMQAVHELGHAAGAWATGGTVQRVVLHPLEISRTDVSPNPRPLVVVWAGPIIGVSLPLAAWGVAAAASWRFAYLLRFFAGYCLVANGAYIAFGSIAGIGDCGEMLRHGSPRWTLWLFGAAIIPCGLWLWHGLGKHFGIGRAALKVELRLVAVLFALLLATFAIQVVLDAR